MPVKLNPNHVIARYERAWVYITDQLEMYACGDVVLTPFFVFVTGHYGARGVYDVVVSQAIPRENITLIDDRSTETCRTHNEMAEEAEDLKGWDAEKEIRD